jgi:glucosyl-3-phosphoglycerate synthase
MVSASPEIPTVADPTRDYTILIPVADLRMAGPLVQVATALMPVHERGARGRIITLGVVAIPEEMAFSEGAIPARLQRQFLGRLRRFGRSPKVEMRALVRVSRQVWQGIVEAAEEEHADLILIGWDGRARADAILGTTIDEAVRNAPCDIAVCRGVRAASATAKRILVPIRGGPHAALAFKLAAGLADRVDGTVTALRIERPSGGSNGNAASAERDLEEFSAVVGTAPTPSRVRELVIPSDSVVDAICKQAESHQIVLMGAAAGRPDPNQLFGPIAEEVARRTDRAIVIVKTRLPGTVTHDVWEPLFTHSAAEQTTAFSISTIVDKWFAENTYDAREFEPLDELVRLKRQQRVRISLGLPTLNEEATIGPIVKSIRAELMERHPLLDEIVVIDSRSQDATRQIVADMGVPLVTHQDILPDHGAFSGKGEALWKSLHVLQGDIIAWIDTDIDNIHPRFVYGLLGPLLRDNRIKFVKGFYKRPIKGPGGLQATGGGRVTELTARPLFNLFFPELSGLLQPLAGEQAGRREVLEQLPFFTGYGVETGLLIDMLEQFGLRAIGQVDLKRRVHRNQPLQSLTSMAFTIIDVAMRRLEQRHRLQLLSEVNRSMKLIRYERDNFSVQERALGDVERPPIATLPEYRAAHPDPVVGGQARRKVTEVILCRHGETDWNLRGFYQGRTDVPLNKRGVDQARELARALRREAIDAVYSSTLARAFETAREIARTHGLPVTRDERFDEIDQGNWEGRTREQIELDYFWLHEKWQDHPMELRLPGGENLLEVRERVRGALDDIFRRHEGQTVCLVAHSVSMAAIKHELQGLPLNEALEKLPKNASWESISVRDYEAVRARRQ